MKNLFTENRIILFIASFFFIIAFAQNLHKYNKIEWNESDLISDTTKSYCGYPSICSTGKSIYVLWLQKDSFFSNEGNIQFSKISGSEKSKTSTIGYINSVFFPPACISDKNGILHYISSGNDTADSSRPLTFPKAIYYSNNENNNWKNPECIFHLPYGKSKVTDWKIKTDKFQNLHIIIRTIEADGSLMRYFLIKNNALIDSCQIMSDCSKYDFLIDENNIIHLVYSSFIKQGHHYITKLFYSISKDKGRTFTDPVTIKQISEGDINSIKIINDNKNTIHIIWDEGTNSDKFSDEILHSFSNGGIYFSYPVKITKVNRSNIFTPKVVCDSNSRLHVVWWEKEKKPSDNTMIFYSYFEGKKWSNPNKIFNGARNPDICIDKSGFLHLAMEIFNNTPNKNVKIYYSKTNESIYSLFNNNQNEK